MSLRTAWLAAAALLLLLVPPVVSADESTDQAALKAAAQAWTKAFNAHDAQALAALATPDVVLMDVDAPPVSGREDARKAWAQAFALTGGELTVANKETQVAGDVAWRIGALARKAPNGNAVIRGQSFEIWKRVNGEWKMHRQMSSGLLARPKISPHPLPSEPVFDTPN